MNSPENLPIPFLEKATRDAKSALLTLLAFCLPMFFVMLGAWAFFDPDEGRYAEIPREMLVRGDWVTPTLNFVTYIEKPPLLYWGTMLSFLTLGFNETAGRLMPALCALLGVLFTYGLGRRMFGSRAGFLGALVLATTIFWAVMARSLIIDPILAATVWGAICFWFLAQSEGEIENGVALETAPAPDASTREAQPRNVETRRTLWLLGFWAMMALGVLAKGPVGVLLPMAVAFLYAATCNRWRDFFRLRWLIGVPLFLLMTVPWFVLVQQRNPQFNEFFWYGQNVARFLGKGKNREHVEPMYYFLMWLPGVFFPWSMFLPGALYVAFTRWKTRRQNRAAGIVKAREYSQSGRGAIYLLIATVFITAFFSISTSKLITYILPAMPPLALLIGWYFENLLRARDEDRWRAPLLSGVWMLAAVVTLVGCVAPIAGFYALQKIEHVFSLWPFFLSAVLLAWCAALITFMRRRRLDKLVFSTAIGSTALFFGAIQIIALVAPNHNCRDLIRAIRPGLQAGGQIIQTDSYYMPSVGFYSGQRVVMVNKSGELDFGKSQLSSAERAKWFPGDEAAFAPLMQQNHPVYSIARDHKGAQQLLHETSASKSAAGAAQKGAAARQSSPQKAMPKIDGLAEIVWNKRRAILGNAQAIKITPPQGNLISPDITEDVKE